jgi:hypothetical protein
MYCSSGQDAPPLRLPLPPRPCLLQQTKADQAEQEAKERKNNFLRRSRAGLANLGLPPGTQNDVVGIALALHSVVMQQ